MWSGLQHYFYSTILFDYVKLLKNKTDLEILLFLEGVTSFELSLCHCDVVFFATRHPDPIWSDAARDGAKATALQG